MRLVQTILLSGYLAGVALIPVMPVYAQTVPIAILDFEANGISESEAIALTDRLRNEMFRIGKFEVVERALIANIMEEQDFQLAGCASTDCLVEIGRLIGAEQVVGGRISVLGTIYTVSARIVDVETGKVIGVSDYDQRGGLEQMLTSGMREVARRLADQAGVVNVAQTEELGDAEQPAEQPAEEPIVAPIKEIPVDDAVSDQEPPSPVVSPEDMLKEIIDPAVLPGWNVAIGYGTLRGINVVTISRDRVLNKKMSIFFALGVGPQPFSIGFTNHSNRGGSGRVRAAAIGLAPVVSIYGFWGKEWSFEESGSVIGGFTGGLNERLGGLFIFPTVSWEYRF